MQIDFLFYLCKVVFSKFDMNTITKHIKPGKVYRRSDLLPFTNAPDRDLAELVHSGILTKLSQGVYYMPRTSDFGIVPPNQNDLVKAFLKDERFLILSSNMYNMLGFGTTQLYNEIIVYNHKRHGLIELGGQSFKFHRKINFPKSLTKEFLIVDFLSNLKILAEEDEGLIVKLEKKASEWDMPHLKTVASKYGSIRAQKILSQLTNIQ